MRHRSAAMENSSLPSDVWNNTTTSSFEDEASNLRNIRDLALKVVFVIIGTLGVLDNLFVIIIFILFIKITEKVLSAILLIKPRVHHHIFTQSRITYM